MKLRDLAARLECELRGDGEVEVDRIAPIEDAGEGALTFISSPRYAAKLGETGAVAVIVPPDLEPGLPSIVSSNPYLTYARAATLLHPARRPEPGVHPTASVHPHAELGEDVHVGAFAVVPEGARVGDRCVIHPHVVLYRDVEIGEECVLHSGVQVREECRLGDRVIIQNGAVIGADGFGFARDAEGRYEKIPQLGIVVIEDDVEIGALTAIDRSSLRETRIGRGAKIDNLVQVGHSVSIGADSALAGQVGIAGSTKVGKSVILAGQVGVAGHIEVGDGVIATAQAGLPSNVAAGSVVSGSPAIDNRSWLKAAAVFSRLPAINRRLKQLERRVEQLFGDKAD